MRIVIIGGVAAGAGAAAKARRENEDAEIIVLEKGEYVSFANCGLPYYVGGTIADRSRLILATPELFKTRFNIDVRTGHSVMKINAESKTLEVECDAGRYTLEYDRLVLGMGCSPVRPNIPGAGLDGVYCVFTIPDADAIVERLGRGISSAVVVGGGFIGLETADELCSRGIRTTLVEKSDRLLTNMDAEFSIPIERELLSRGVRVLLGSAVSSIEGEKTARAVRLDDGTRVEADIVIFAAGVKPQTGLAAEAGIELGASGGIRVDASMQTSMADVFAAGDVAESTELVSGKAIRNSLAGSANKQGRAAGCNAAGGGLLFKGVLGTSIVKVGGLTCAWTGLNESGCLRLEYDFETAYLYSSSSAGYYPGAGELIIKLTFLRGSGKLLGAQIVGRKGADKRIDVYAAALYAGLTVFDLENLDLAYAPPYSSAKDPVVMSGMVAGNIVRGKVRSASPFGFAEIAKKEGGVLLDVRSREEFDAGHLKGAVSFPIDGARERLSELDKGKKYFVYCGVGYRGYVFCRMLAQKGYDAVNMSGGYFTATMDI